MKVVPVVVGLIIQPIAEYGVPYTSVVGEIGPVSPRFQDNDPLGVTLTTFAGRPYDNGVGTTKSAPHATASLVTWHVVFPDTVRTHTLPPLGYRVTVSACAT